MPSFFMSKDHETKSRDSSNPQETALQRQLDEQHKEIILRSEIAAQLAEKVVVLRRQLCQREEELQRANEAMPTPTTHCTVAATSTNNTAAGVSVASAECAELQRRLAEMESQSATWKQNVKLALKQSQERERFLLSEKSALQDKLNELNFQLEASTLRSARHIARESRETQTDALRSPRNSRTSSLDDTATLEPSVPRGHEPQPQPQPQPPSRSQSQSQSQSLLASRLLDETMRRTVFPYPPQPLGKSGVPPPFIVAVHYENTEGWCVETKLYVSAGMTVLQLKESCCAQFHERYHRKIEPCEHCICTTHHKTGRHVVLSDFRELHSFAYFQRCEREKIQITLFLNPVDALSRVVNDAMNLALVSPGHQLHRSSN